MILTKTARAVIGTVVIAALATSACGNDDASTGSSDQAGVVDVIASFYPLQYVAQRVGGTYVKVSNLTPPGAEPHDLELAASDLTKMRGSDLVVYLADFTPAVDEAVKTAAADHALDVAGAARLDLEATEEDGHEGEAAGDDHAVDPHFWLDPTRLADVADVVATRLAELRPEAAEAFRANAAALRADLVALDADFTAKLTTCRNTALVTGHSAFAYLAAKYGLTQVGITGISPEAEPNPADLAAVATFVKANGVTTVYSEVLMSPAIARTVADETGAVVAVLDPLEGLAENSGGDYLSIMRTNLATLVEGQGCS